MQGILTVPKEIIGEQHFIKEDVLKDKLSRKLRMAALNKALILGNLYHQKVNIVYILRNGELQQVETTVWEVDGEFVSLKGGTSIPVHAILEIEF